MNPRHIGFHEKRARSLANVALSVALTYLHSAVSRTNRILVQARLFFLSPLPKLIDTFEKSLADVHSAWRDGRSAALVVLYNVCVGGRWRSRRGLQPIQWMRLWDAWAAAFNKWILARTQDYGGVQKWNYVNTHQSSDVHWIWMRAPIEVAIDWKNMADIHVLIFWNLSSENVPQPQLFFTSKILWDESWPLYRLHISNILQ